MKKILAALCAVVCAGLCACGQLSNSTDSSSSSAANAESTAESDSETAVYENSEQNDENTAEDNSAGEASTDSEVQICEGEDFSAESEEDLAEGAMACVTQCVEYTSNAEYSKAASLMTADFAESGSIIGYADGEDAVAATVTFDSSATEITEEADGSVTILLLANVSLADDPSSGNTEYITVVYDGNNYLISSNQILSSTQTEQDEQSLTRAYAKTIYTATANVMADMEVDGSVPEDGEYYNGDGTDFVASVNESLGNTNVDFNVSTAQYVISITGGQLDTVTYYIGGYSAQYPNDEN